METKKTSAARKGNTRNKRYSPAVERKLLAVYYSANSADLEYGTSWYEIAHSICKRISDSYGVSLPQACGVVAALSPGRNWEKNIEDAESFVSAYQSGLRGRYLPVVGTYGKKNVAKSIAILEGKEPLQVLGGQKVRSFFANILNPSDEIPVTIDRHAKCAAYGVKNADNSIVKPSEYEYIAEHYRRAADKVELKPCQFQAIVWVVWRRVEGDLAAAVREAELDTVPF